MIASLSEMTTWSTEEARDEVQRTLPSGWTFKITHQRPFQATIADGDGKSHWEGFNYEERLILLDAYVYLALREAPRATEGPWAIRHGELTSETVQRQAMKLPDPEDLDPAELAMAYSVGGSDDD
jgi:hypothetical protein